MGAAIGLREDFGSADLRGLARSSKDANQARRLLALAVIYDGGRRMDAVQIVLRNPDHLTEPVEMREFALRAEPFHERETFSAPNEAIDAVGDWTIALKPT